MKRAIATMVALGSMAALPAQAAVIGFNDPYAPGQWTTTVLGTLNGGSPNPGSAVMTTTALTLTGGNAISPNPASDAPACVGGTYGFLSPCEIRITTAQIQNPFSFRWSYTTADTTGPGGDLFGVLVNGVRTPLSDVGGPISQSGVLSVNATSSFGWFINCTDCIGGAATATITNFQVGQVPEPASFALLAAGIAALWATLRRKGARPSLGST